jgi:Tol biopolymer transport system component
VRDSATTSDVYAHPADGSGPDRFLARLDRQVQEVAWSPDGNWLLLRTDNGTRGNADIVGVRTHGDTTPVPLVATSFTEMEPAVSPDGKWLAYSSNQSGVPEVYVRPFPATGGGQWQVSNGGGSAPDWSSDGRELFYEGSGLQFMAAEVATKPTFFVQGLRPLFSMVPFMDPGYHQAYAVAPDGKSFYFAMQGRSAAARGVHLVWVDHWFSDLQQRLKR